MNRGALRGLTREEQNLGRLSVDYAGDEESAWVAGGPPTVLGAANRIWVPRRPTSATRVALPLSPNGQFASVGKGLMNPIPVMFTRDFTGYLAFRLNGAGSSDIVVTATVWEAHPTGACRPGRAFSSYTNAVGVATGEFTDSVVRTWRGMTTYWMALSCAGTTAPTATTCWPQEKVTIDTPGNFSSWPDNNPWSSNTWRYSNVATDLTATVPLTGDASQNLAVPFFRSV